MAARYLAVIVWVPPARYQAAILGGPRDTQQTLHGTIVVYHKVTTGGDREISHGHHGGDREVPHGHRIGARGVSHGHPMRLSRGTSRSLLGLPLVISGYMLQPWAGTHKYCNGPLATPFPCPKVFRSGPPTRVLNKVSAGRRTPDIPLLVRAVQETGG